MRYELIISAQARDEYEEAFEYYHNISFDLGSSFSLEVLTFLERIETNPFQFQAHDSDFMRAHLKKFPYTIFYKAYKSEKKVKVVSVWHQGRLKSSWKP